MTSARKILWLLTVLILICFLSCSGQERNKAVDHQTAIDTTLPELYGIPEVIASSDTSPGWNQKGQRLLLTGSVYKSDGKTPAPDVVLYYYQTNIAGRYLHKETEKRSLPPNSLGQTHGYIRGWVKTDRQGRYTIYTAKPGAYPSRDEPAHVHITVKEPALNSSYYLDDFVFDDDKLLTTEKRLAMKNRGGGGVLRLVQRDGLQVGERNIILGLNIPDYPNTNANELHSGRNVGEDVISFTPSHAWGPDKGTKTCPICKYGWYHGILYFVGNRSDWNEIKQWLTFLETESKKREQYLKVYFIYGNDVAYDKVHRENELERLGSELRLEKVALTFVPSFTDTISEINLNKINPALDNTFILYKRSRIIDKYTNLKANRENFNLISQRLDQTINEYFHLPKIQQE